MLYNASRTLVANWAPGQPSICPECGGRLVAKRGQIVAWHWAHAAGERESNCEWVESEWHLAWKARYMAAPGWEVEVPVLVGGRSFRLDAFCWKKWWAVELVHTLSPYYEAKHLALDCSGYTVLWIIDGNHLRSARATPAIGRGGFDRLLRPAAADLVDRIVRTGAGRVLVDLAGRLYSRWLDSSTWYPWGGGFFVPGGPGVDGPVFAR